MIAISQSVQKRLTDDGYSWLFPIPSRGEVIIAQKIAIYTLWPLAKKESDSALGLGRAE